MIQLFNYKKLSNINVVKACRLLPANPAVLMVYIKSSHLIDFFFALLVKGL